MDKEGTIATSRSNAGSHPLAMATSSLLWGWVAFAGCLALGWGSLLRPGEIFGLQRKNLLFPSDCGHSVSYCLVSLRRHGSQQRDTRAQGWIFLTSCRLSLWLLRSRVLDSLQLPTSHTTSVKALDPSRYVRAVLRGLLCKSPTAVLS